MSEARWNEWLGPNLAVSTGPRVKKIRGPPSANGSPRGSLPRLAWPGERAIRGQRARAVVARSCRALLLVRLQISRAQVLALLHCSNKVLPLPCHVRLLLAPRRLIPARSSCGAHRSGAQWSVRRPRRQIWAQPRPNRHTHLQPVRRPLQHPPADAAAISRY